MIHRNIFSYLLFFFLSCTLANAQPDSLWMNIAHATHIVEGVFNVDTNKINKIKNTESDYVDVEFNVKSVLKGELSQSSLSLKEFICNKKEREPYCDESKLTSFNGKKVIAFIHKRSYQLYKENKEITEFYFSGRSFKSIFPDTAEIKSRIRNEIERQKLIVNNKLFMADCPCDSNYSKVKKFIEGMLSESTAEQAYAGLEKMGDAAVPSMICLMDDKRELTVNRITLKNNRPNAWEANRHYSIYVVQDALDAILNQLTAQSFGLGDYKNASNEIRTNAVNGWSVYLWYRTAAK